MSPARVRRPAVRMPGRRWPAARGMPGRLGSAARGMPGRLRRAPIRTRVLSGVLLITLVALVAFDIAAVTALRGYLLGHTDSQLESVLSLYRLAPQESFVHVGRKVLGPPPAQVVMVAGPRLLLRPALLDQYYVEFRSGRGWETLLRGNPALVPRFGLAVPARRASIVAQSVVSRNGRTPLRLRAKLEAGGALIASTSLATVNKTVERLTLILAIASAVAGTFVALAVAWVMRRGLRPIETMAAQADRITAGDLTDRVSLYDARTEVGRLAAALNGMLTRIEAAIQERAASQELTRRFFADASHELRNPLASLRANAELYQQGALARRPQVDEAMGRIALEAQRMSTLVDDMLRLAQLDYQPCQQHGPVDVTAVVSRCAERARAAGPHRAWRTGIEAGLTATGDEELLRRAVDNLLANVRVHTPREAAATITATQQDGIITIEVSDTGPGVPASQLPLIFGRFYRATASPHCRGSGLGLAIVAATAAAYQGTAEASPNRPHGLRVTLTLPASRELCAAQEPSASSTPARTGR